MPLESRLVAVVQAIAADIKAIYTSLAGKAASSHTHPPADLTIATFLKTFLGTTTTAAARTALEIPVGPTVYNASGVVTAAKVFIGTATTASNGTWSINYSHVGFTEILGAVATSEALSTGVGERTLTTLSPGNPTMTSCAGVVVTSTGAGLLAAVALTNANGAKVTVTVWGK